MGDQANGTRARAAARGCLRREIIYLDEGVNERTATRWIEVWRGVDNHRRRLIRAVSCDARKIYAFAGSIAAARRILEG